MRVLLAGDDPANRRHLEDALRERGWEVTTVTDGGSAEAHFRAAPAALVVLVLVDAVEVCRRIRAAPGGETSHLLVAGADAAILPREIAAAGADDFLLLPISPAELHVRLSLAASRIERVQATRRQSEERYRRFFEEDLSGDFLSTADGHILECNAALAHILGYESTDALKRTNGASLYPSPAAREEFLALLRRQGKVEQHELELRQRDGTPLHVVENVIGHFDERGELIEFHGYVFDITERKQAEAQLQQQAEELQRANEELRQRTREVEAAMQARSQLYARLHHELRTPLSAIMLFNDLLLDGVLGTLTPLQRSGVERAQDAARHLLELVQDVLDLSKVEAGRIVLQPIRIAIPELVDDLLAMVRPLAESRGCELRVERMGKSCTANTDPRRLRQILFNLLSNAIKFGRARPVTLRWRKTRRGEAILEVADQGEGIAPEDLPHIFEDFAQLGSAQEEGSGLGLAISRRLTHLLGGRLEVESTPGQGSTFRLVLPPHPPASSTVENGAERTTVLS